MKYIGEIQFIYLIKLDRSNHNKFNEESIRHPPLIKPNLHQCTNPTISPPLPQLRHAPPIYTVPPHSPYPPDPSPPRLSAVDLDAGACTPPSGCLPAV